MNTLKNIFTEPVRAWLYRIALSAGSLAAVYGLLTDEQTVALLGLVSAILNVLPTLNTSTKKHDS
jgi:hypothetical protein